jgi:hypothetical protein
VVYRWNEGSQHYDYRDTWFSWRIKEYEHTEYVYRYEIEAAQVDWAVHYHCDIETLRSTIL